jgi:dihydroflavonol-4-reductase
LKILVTGATGFIGGAICRELSARGARVRAFHRSSSNTALLDDLPVEHHIGKLEDPGSLARAVKGVDAVFHCAAQLGSHGDWQKYQSVTIQGTRDLLAAAREARVKRFIHTSSVAALGVPENTPHSKETPLLSENHTWNFPSHRWPYGYAKYLAELEVQHAVALGLDAVILNPSSVFGAGDLLRARNTIIRTVTEHGMRLSTSGGMNIVHIHDVVQGHLAALEYGHRGERYILGGENLTHHKFLSTIMACAGIHARLIAMPLSLVRLMRILARTTTRLMHLEINPGILELAGYHFYYDLEKSMRVLKLSVPLDAHQALADAFHWFKEHPNT